MDSSDGDRFAVVLLVVPDFLTRIVGLAAEIAFYKVYPLVQEREFGEWQSTHPDLLPSNGWGAVGWGFAGLVFFFIVAFLVMYPLMLLFPSLQ